MQEALFEMPVQRSFMLDRYNQLTEEKWDLLAKLAELEIGRVALARAIQETL